MKDVISTVKKLLKMAEGKSSASEAANAAAIAQTLITKHRIDVSKLSDDEEEHIKKCPPLYRSNNITHWRSDLGHWITKLNGCVMYHANYNDGTKGLGVVGRPSDVLFCRWLFDHCCKEIDRLAKEAMTAGKGTGKKWSNSFRHGAVNIISQRMRQAHAEQMMQSQKEEITAIVKLDNRDEVVNNWIIKHMETKPSTATGKREFSATAYIAGQEAGRDIILNRPLEAKKNDSIQN